MTQTPPARSRGRDLYRAALRLGTTLAGTVLPVIPAGVKWRVPRRRPIVVDRNTLDPMVQWLLGSLRLAGVRRMMFDESDLDASRGLFRDTLVALGGPPLPARVDDVVIPGPADPITVRHYRPLTKPFVAGAAAPLLVFFHGGGYVLGDLESYDALCRRICHDAEVQVLSVDYRRAPEHPAPAAVDDCLAAYRWAVQHATELGADPDRIAVGGDSAGGALAAVVARLTRDAGEPLPALQVLIYPWTDLTAPSRSRTLFPEGFILTAEDLDWFAAAYLQGSDLGPDDPRVSPLRADELAGLPPALVLTAAFDPLCDEGERYAGAMRLAGVLVDLRCHHTLTHGFANFHALGAGCAAAIDDLIEALRTQLRA